MPVAAAAEPAHLRGGARRYPRRTRKGRTAPVRSRPHVSTFCGRFAASISSSTHPGALSLSKGACVVRARRVKIRGVLSPRQTITPACARVATAFVVIGCVTLGARILAHPAPFSYLDAHVTAKGLTGRLVLHDLDVAHELKIEPPSQVADPAFTARQAAAVAAFLQPRLTFFTDGRPIPWTLTRSNPSPIRMPSRCCGRRPRRVPPAS